VVRGSVKRDRVVNKNTAKPRYNALQGTEPGERYKWESVICRISLFAVFLNVFPKKEEKTGKKAKKRDKSVEKSFKKLLKC